VSCQRQEGVGQMACGPGLGRGSGGVGHAGAAGGVGEDRLDLHSQPIGGCVALGEDDGGANIAEDAGVDGLLVAAGARERDEDGGEADVSQFGDGAGAGAADDQVGGGVEVGELVAYELEDAISVSQLIRK
jgi:hypothetical protein